MKPAPHRRPSAPESTRDSCAAHCPLAAPRLDRRTFLSEALLATAAFALAACGGGDSPTAPFSGSFSLTVSSYAALATVGGVALVSANGSPLAVVRTGDSSFVALSRICPHQGSTINTSAEGFLCPGHGARFNLQGTWVGGQATSNMRAYATRYDAAAGTLTIG